jgi:DNA adenine methylase
MTQTKFQIRNFPRNRFMGSKHRLLDFIHENVQDYKFNTVLDAFSGSAAVAFMFKNMRKRVDSNDILKYSYHISKAIIENEKVTLSKNDISSLLEENKEHGNFIQKTFKGLYFSNAENKFLDQTISNIKELNNPFKRSIALAALARACLKKRPRGVFTYTGMRYDDGRKDMKISFAQQFTNSIEIFNEAVFDNGKKNTALNEDVFNLEDTNYDAVYFDPPYCSLYSDNDYSRRYHFIEGLVSYWSHVKVNHDTKTKKFNRIVSPFDTKRTVYDAFERLFDKFKDSTIIVSYSSNSLPTMNEMLSIMKRFKSNVKVAEFSHKYSFGTQHSNLKNNTVREFLFIGDE